MPRFLLLLIAVSGSTSAQADGLAKDVDQLRKDLRHGEALAVLQDAVDEGSADAARELAEVALEAALVARLSTPPSEPLELLTALQGLELSAHEELALARLSFLFDLAPLGEGALGRARDLAPDLKGATDRILAAARAEELPDGGYFRYRGRWMPLAERDRERLFDYAIEALWAVDPDREAFRMEPRTDAPNRALFLERFGTEGVAFLRRRAQRIADSSDADYNEVRSWLTSYNAPSLREKLVATFEVMREPRAEALALIARYGKSEQHEVDAYRRKLEALYEAHERVLVRDWRGIDQVDPSHAYEIVQRVRSREEALAHVDRYLAAYEGAGLPAARVVPLEDADTSAGHVLPGREQSGLEDVLWLVLHDAADQHLDVMARGAELSRNLERLTAWEAMVLSHVKLRSIEAHNARVATTLDDPERECCTALDDYRKALGLDPLEIEERLVTSARKHSREMIDLGYFGHVSPVERNRSPSDRARLEGYGGGVGENILAGSTGGRGAFEGWYHSPGHHRNLVSAGPQIGVGAAGGFGMWTMVVGGTDLAWRSLHRDLPPARSKALAAKVRALVVALTNGRSAEEQIAEVRTDFPDALAQVANEAFAAARVGKKTLSKAAPALLDLIVDAEVPVVWRPLQVAAVAAAIDLLDSGSSEAIRAASFALVEPLVAGTDGARSGFGYDASVSHKKRMDPVLELRREWEDVAQFRYRADGIVSVQPPARVPGRVGDGPSRRSPLRPLSKRERRRIAERHGGGSETEDAVDAGLAWLAGVQDEDGAWRARSFALNLEGVDPADPLVGRGNNDWEVAITGLALLAFCSAGHTTDQGDHAQTVDAGARFLIAQLTDYGRFDTAAGQYMYSHAIATQALCELYAYSDDPVLGVYAQYALDFLVYAQDPRGGGWRYEAKQAGDTSVTGWAVMSLNAGSKAGLDVAGYRDALRFLDSVTDGGYYHVRYMPGGQGATNRLGSIGALCRLFLDGNKRSARVLWAARRMLQELPTAGGGKFYYWYYGSLVMFQLGDGFWDEWNAALRPALLGVQDVDEDSPFVGAWPARGDYAGQGGRVMQTSLAILMLTTYYRYDREHEPRIRTLTGDVDALTAPYLDVIVSDADEQARRVTEAKVVDDFGVALAPVLIRELRRPELALGARERLAALLERVATRRHEAAVIELLAAETQPSVAQRLTFVLRVVCSARSAESLARQLENESRDVRLIAVRTLGQLGVVEASVSLSARLADEPDAAVKAEIEKALSALAEPVPVVALVDVSLERDDPRRLAVIDGLGFLSSDELARELLVMAEGDKKLFEDVVEAVREHGREAGIPVLITALRSRDEPLRALALKALVTYTGRDLGYRADGRADERKKAVRRWEEWWEEVQDGAR